MPISRRNFLRTSSIAVVAAGTTVPITALAAEEAPAAKAARRQAGLMNKSAFAPHLNSTFVLKPEDTQPVQVKLIDLRDIGPKPKAKRGRAFCRPWTRANGSIP